MFSRFSRKLPSTSLSKRLFSSCHYEPPFFFRFGYIGAFVIGSFFTLVSRADHQSLCNQLGKIDTELEDVKKLLSEKNKK